MSGAFVQCPACGIMINLMPLNCRIVRCGAKVLAFGRLEQFPQHAKREEIEALLRLPHVGCGTPLKYNVGSGLFDVVGWDS